MLRRVLVAFTLVLSAPAQVLAATQSIGVPVTEPQPVTLTGELYIPRGTAPHPAVVLLHGCGGMTANVPAWAEWLQAEGYAALALDSFKARGLQSVCADSRLFTGVMRAGDVFAAVARLKTVSAVDPNRIAAMGFSHGGGTLLAAWRQAARHPDQKLRGMIAFYPGGCVGALAPADAPPLLMLVGGRDDWTPPEPCEKLAGTAKDAGRPVSIVVYPDAYHHFDGADLKKRVYSSVARGGKGATMEYNPKAHADSEKQVRVFLETHMKP